MTPKEYEAIVRYRKVIGANSKQHAKKKYIKEYVDLAVEKALTNTEFKSDNSYDLAKEKQNLRHTTRMRACAEAEYEFENFWEKQKIIRSAERRKTRAAKTYEDALPVNATYEDIYNSCPRYMNRFTVDIENSLITCWHKNAIIKKNINTGKFYYLQESGRKFTVKNKAFIVYHLVKDNLPAIASSSKTYSLDLDPVHHENDLIIFHERSVYEKSIGNEDVDMNIPTPYPFGGSSK
jgi:hypothetical protein